MPQRTQSAKMAPPSCHALQPVSRLQRRVLSVLALAALAGLAYGGWMLWRLAPIGSGYAAKMLCSGVFVSGRDPLQVINEDILAGNPSLLRLTAARVDRATMATSATFLGMARREAQFRPGLGCTLALAGSLRRDALPAHTAPTGEALPLAATPAMGDAGGLNGALDWAFAEPDPARLQRTRAVVVVQRGGIIAERYAPGFSAQTPMPGWSMTKTVAGALTGILVGEGRLSLDSRALLPEWRTPNDGRRAITLDQLLRMTDGLRFNERSGDLLSDVVLMLLATGDASGFASAKPLEYAPGLHWRYANGTSNVLARVLRHAVDDRDLSAFVRRALFGRIGLRRAVLEPDATGTPVLSSFMYATAREWAAIGQLLLQDGVWRGVRILPPGWVQYMRTPTPQCPRGDFGAHLWIKVPEPFASISSPPPALPTDAFHLAGHEGQLVSVVPSRQLVVVRLGLTRDRHAWDHEAFLARVLRSLEGR